MMERFSRISAASANLRLAFLLNLGFTNVLTTHLAVEANATREDILHIRNRVRLLLENTDFKHTTVEIGYENEYCRMKEP